MLARKRSICGLNRQVTDSKPFAPSADRNKQVILEALQSLLTGDERVFEIGSGTGQHACHIASAMPGLVWQPTELADKLPGIERWIEEYKCTNVLPPVVMDLACDIAPLSNASVCYTANTLHIVSWSLVQALFKFAATLLEDKGKLIVYGPFSINGHHTSEGNRLFDEQLRVSDPQSGIRELGELNELACLHKFSEAKIIDMPANNKLLCWQKPGLSEQSAR